MRQNSVVFRILFVALVFGAELLAACSDEPSRSPESRARASEPAEKAKASDADAAARATSEACGDAGCSAHHDELNRGLLCVTTDKAQRAGGIVVQNRLDRNEDRLALGKAAYVVIDSEPCVTTSRLRNAAFRCTVAPGDAGTLVVESHYVYDELDRGITEDCQRLNTVCKLPKLAAGTHTLRFGDDSLELTLPGNLQGACLHRR